MSRILALSVETAQGPQRMLLEESEPATSPTLPEPSEPDMARLAGVAAKYGTELLGPFPE